jgi:3-dehydroquinate synthase
MNNISCQSYNVVFDQPWATLNALVKEKAYSKIFVLVDTLTEEHCLPILKEKTSFDSHVISIPSGEKYKTIETCQTIWSSLIESQADRHSCLLNLGGGVIGDMGGFCASTFMRGIDFVQVPTTLLSQVDASVGSKLGIDYLDYKNIVGVFNEPQAVLIDVQFLQTLIDRELRSGYAEVIKHALIQDANLWQDLQSIKDLKAVDWLPIVHRNVDIKKTVVDQDPYEKGLRKILNFGHTIGHAVETNYLHQEHPLLHGEAIAIGMIVESWIAKEKGLLNESAFKEIEAYIRSIYDDLPSEINNQSSVLAHMKADKKNKGGVVLASLVTGIGECGFDVKFEQKEALQGMESFSS